MPLVDERLVSGSSIAGCGVRPVGFRRVPPDRVDVMQWTTVFFVPVFPLRRYVGEYVEESRPQDDRDEQFVFANGERRPLTTPRVAGIYAITVTQIAVALLPTILVLSQIAGARQWPFWQMVGIALAFLWPFAFMVLLRIWNRRFLESTWDADRASEVADDRHEEQTAVRSRWREKHLIPEGAYLAVAIAGALPGVALAIWKQWGDLGFLAGIIVGAAALLIPLHLLDRWLVRNRDETGLKFEDIDADVTRGRH